MLEKDKDSSCHCIAYMCVSVLTEFVTPPREVQPREAFDPDATECHVAVPKAVNALESDKTPNGSKSRILLVGGTTDRGKLNEISV